MNKILIILVFSFLSLFGNNFELAVQKASGTNKLILVELVMEFCPYCERMEKAVLSKADIKKILQEKYVFIKLDINNDEIPYNLTSRLTPTFYFLSNDGEKVLEEVKGLTKKSNFKFFLEEVYEQEIIVN